MHVREVDRPCTVSCSTGIQDAQSQPLYAQQNIDRPLTVSLGAVLESISIKVYPVFDEPRITPRYHDGTEIWQFS